MSHYIKFSMPSIHILNARREIDSMKDVDNIKFDINSNEDNIYYEIFKNNVQHGVLAIYSINAALESVITILNKELKIEEQIKQNRKTKKKIEFSELTSFLINELKIITDTDSYYECIALRRYRNSITHWNEDKSTLLGTSGYLPLMFKNGGVIHNDKKEELISILTKRKLEEYKGAFDKLLENMISSKIIQKEEVLKNMLRCIIDMRIEYEG